MNKRQRTALGAKVANKSKLKRSSGGGAGTSGGVEFQANVTAIAGAHLLCGTPVRFPPVLRSTSKDGADDLRCVFKTPTIQSSTFLNDPL